MSENAIKTQVIDELVARGFLVIRINGGRKGKIAFFRWFVKGRPSKTGGVSDILALSPSGRLYAIEAKQPGKKATDDQKDFLTEVQDRKGIGLVLTDVDDLAMIGA